ncbi:MAG: TAXI family TRAP transporter solute-binding subunit [Pseudomonadota bacterium]
MNRIWTALLSGAFALTATMAQSQTLSVEGGGAASLTGIVPQTFAQYASKADVDVQVVLGQTLTRSALKLAAGKIDMAVVPPPAFGAMKKGVGPYKKQADQAKSLSANVRSLFAFPAGTFHAIVWADSGIENWSDIKDKRVYIGPPAGAASRQIQGMIGQASGGLSVEGDYEGIRAPWGAAQQSFQDGQFDVYVASAAVGQQSLNELSLQRTIKILGIPDGVRDGDGWKDYMVNSAMMMSEIPAGTYSGQANGDANLVSVASAMMMSVHKDMPEETAYKLTKAYWDNLQEMKNSNALLKTIDEEAPFAGTNAPLHPGALRYYQEAGIKVPDNLIQ